MVVTLIQSEIRDHIKAAWPSLSVAIFVFDGAENHVLSVYDATTNRSCSSEIKPSDYSLSIEALDKAMLKPMLTALKSK